MYNMSSKKEKKNEERNHEKRRARQREIKKGGGSAEKRGWRKWLLRDQPYVRLASGDINTSDAAGATILPFTAGEGDKNAHKRERGRELERTGLPPLPPGQKPHLQVQHLQMKARTKRWMFISCRAGVRAALKQIAKTVDLGRSALRLSSARKLIISEPQR